MGVRCNHERGASALPRKRPRRRRERTVKPLGDLPDRPLLAAQAADVGPRIGSERRASGSAHLVRNGDPAGCRGRPDHTARLLFSWRDSDHTIDTLAATLRLADRLDVTQVDVDTLSGYPRTREQLGEAGSGFDDVPEALSVIALVQDLPFDWTWTQAETAMQMVAAILETGMSSADATGLMLEDSIARTEVVCAHDGHDCPPVASKGVTRASRINSMRSRAAGMRRRGMRRRRERRHRVGSRRGSIRMRRCMAAPTGWTRALAARRRHVVARAPATILGTGGFIVHRTHAPSGIVSDREEAARQEDRQRPDDERKCRPA